MAWPGTLSPGFLGNVAHLDDRVEEDQGDDQPEHELRLADVADCPLVLAVPSKKNMTNIDLTAYEYLTCQISSCF